MIEVNEDSEEYSSNIKKLKFLNEQMGLLRNFFLTRDKNGHSLHHEVPSFVLVYTINSEINNTPKGVYLPISKLHSILAVGNLLAYNNL